MTVRTMGANPARHTARRCPTCSAGASRGLPRGGRHADAPRTPTTTGRPTSHSSPEAPDAKTGRRQLEEITFEVCDSQRTRATCRRRRGVRRARVRRVFYVRVDEGAVYEWRRASDAGTTSVTATPSRDRCFVVPIPVQALLQRGARRRHRRRALLARGNAVVVAAVDAARAAGVSDGRKAGRDEGLKAGRDEGAPVAARALLFPHDGAAASRSPTRSGRGSRPADDPPRSRAGTTSPCSRRAPTRSSRSVRFVWGAGVSALRAAVRSSGRGGRPGPSSGDAASSLRRAAAACGHVALLLAGGGGGRRARPRSPGRRGAGGRSATPTRAGASRRGRGRGGGRARSTRARAVQKAPFTRTPARAHRAEGRAFFASAAARAATASSASFTSAAKRSACARATRRSRPPAACSHRRAASSSRRAPGA